MKEKKKKLYVLILLLLLGVTSVYIANTYAKYASDFTVENGNATVAKWNFNANIVDGTNELLTIDGASTIDPKTLASGKIAPGTKGSFDIELNKGTTETGIDYTVKLKSVDGAPTNLKFYYQENNGGTLGTKNQLTLGDDASGKLTGRFDANAPAGTKKTYKILWEWPYETTGNGDADDTSAGETPTSFKISLEISGIQTKPVQSTN